MASMVLRRLTTISCICGRLRDGRAGDRRRKGAGLPVPGGHPCGGCRQGGISNGKSSIVEERLYSFLLAFFPKKTKFRFFVFSSFTQLGTKTFVFLRSCKIFKRFTLLCIVFLNFWNNPISFTFNFEKVGLIPFASLLCREGFL